MANSLSRKNTWRMLLVIGAVALLLGVLFAWFQVLFPVMIAFILAAITHPLASFFERRGWPRILGLVLILLIVAGVFLLLFGVFLPAMVHQLVELGKKLPSWQEVMESHVGPWLNELKGRYPDAYAMLHGQVMSWIKENLPTIAKRLVSWIVGIIAPALGLANILLNLILIPVIAAYLTMDFNRVVSTLALMVPRPVLPQVEKVMRDVIQVLRDFLYGQLMVALALGVIYTIGLLIVRAPLALAIGPLAGILALVPYLGFIVGLGLAAFLTFLEYGDLWHLMGVVITFGVAQFIEGWVLTPQLLGKRVGLHPVWVVIALLLGGELFGISGIVVAVPVAAVLRVVLRHALITYQESSLYLGTHFQIAFYTRSDCPTCQEFEGKLKDILDRRGLRFKRVDIDAHRELKERLGSRVPLLEVNDQAIAEGPLSVAEIEQRFERAWHDFI